MKADVRKFGLDALKGYLECLVVGDIPIKAAIKKVRRDRKTKEVVGVTFYEWSASLGGRR